MKESEKKVSYMFVKTKWVLNRAEPSTPAVNRDAAAVPEKYFCLKLTISDLGHRHRIKTFQKFKFLNEGKKKKKYHKYLYTYIFIFVHIHINIYLFIYKIFLFYIYVYIAATWQNLATFDWFTYCIILPSY